MGCSQAVRRRIANPNIEGSNPFISSLTKTLTANQNMWLVPFVGSNPTCRKIPIVVKWLKTGLYKQCLDRRVQQYS